MKIEYVTLSYYPQTFNVEHINVGFVLHDIETGKLYSRFVKKKNRWLEFDDRLTKEIIDDLLGFAKRTFDQTFGDYRNNSIFGSNSLSAWKYKPGYFDFISRNFQNQMRLSPSLTAEVNNPYKFFEEMCHLSLFFDYDKSERYKEAKIHSVLLQQAKGILSNSSLDLSSRVLYQDKIEDESILFDYKFDNYYLKVINPNSENATLCIDRVKVWAYNARYFNDSAKMLLFIPLDGVEREHYRYLKKILSGINAEVFYSAHSLNEYVKKLSSGITIG